MRTLKAVLLITLSLALGSPVKAAVALPLVAQLERSAGAPAHAPTLSDTERQELAEAQRRASTELEQLRGGDLTLTDHDIQVIVIVALVVVVIVILV